MADSRALKRCTVDAIAPDGRRTSCEVEVTSRNSAVVAFNCKAVGDAALIRPLPDNGTVFEVTPSGGTTQRVSSSEVLLGRIENIARARRTRPRD
jgi:hypothetical protein